MHVPITQPTLLQRLRNPSDEAAWRLFESRYRELVVRFARSQGLQSADAEDVAQAVLSSLFSTLPRFEYDPEKGRFRDYLFRAARNAIARHMGRAGRPTGSDEALGDLEGADPGGEVGGLSSWQSSWEAEWINHHYRLALATIRTTFEAGSIAIFERCLRGEAIRDIAQTTGMTEAAVHKVKQRIRDRMRELVASQIKDEESG